MEIEQMNAQAASASAADAVNETQRLSARSAAAEAPVWNMRDASAASIAAQKAQDEQAAHDYWTERWRDAPSMSAYDPQAAAAADAQRRQQTNTIGLIAGGVLGIPGFAARGLGAPEPVVEAVTDTTVAVGMLAAGGGFRSRIIEPAYVPEGWVGNPEFASELHGFAENVEPKVTPALQATAEANGGQMVGLGDRLKTVDSLTRKLSDFPDRAINDALRYTMVFEGENFTSGVRGTMDAMNQQGYELVKLGNSFREGAPYKGINATYRTAEGQEFELQFHTPESLYMKETVNHPLYEQQRVLEGRTPEWTMLRDQMILNSNKVPIPDGARHIKAPRR